MEEKYKYSVLEVISKIHGQCKGTGGIYQNDELLLLVNWLRERIKVENWHIEERSHFYKMHDDLIHQLALNVLSIYDNDYRTKEK